MLKVAASLSKISIVAESFGLVAIVMPGSLAAILASVITTVSVPSTSESATMFSIRIVTPVAPAGIVTVFGTLS